MPTDPEDIAQLAFDIAHTYPDNDAALRSAVSRLYYSVFLRARDRLGVRQRRQTHSQVRAAITKATKRSIGDAMGDLIELREQADYEMQHDN